MAFLIRVSIMDSITSQRTSKISIPQLSGFPLGMRINIIHTRCAEIVPLSHMNCNRSTSFIHFAGLGWWFPPSPGMPPSATSWSAWLTGVCVSLPCSPSNVILKPPLLPPLLPMWVIRIQFGMGRRECGIASLEGAVPPTDIYQRIPWRPYPYSPYRGWVSSLMCGNTTSLGWCSPPVYMGKSLVLSPDSHQSPLQPSLPDVESLQWATSGHPLSSYCPHYGSVPVSGRGRCSRQ